MPVFYTRMLLVASVTATAATAPLAAQQSTQVQAAVDAAYSKYKGLKEGKNADYIPALAKVDPDVFGIAVISPPLDDAGNSVRAQKAIADISNALGGNPYAAKPALSTAAK